MIFLYIFAIVLSFLLAFIPTLLFAALTASCGGRENCGKKWCPIGFVNDYPSLFIGMELLLIVAFITLAASGGNL